MAALRARSYAVTETRADRIQSAAKPVRQFRCQLLRGRKDSDMDDMTLRDRHRRRGKTRGDVASRIVGPKCSSKRNRVNWSQRQGAQSPRFSVVHLICVTAEKISRSQ